MSSEDRPSDQKARPETIEIVQRNWQAEVETAQTYRDLAERERDEKQRHFVAHGGSGRAARAALGKETERSRRRAAGLQRDNCAPVQSLVEQNCWSRNCDSSYGSDGRTAGSAISRSSQACISRRTGCAAIFAAKRARGKGACADA